MSGMVNTPRSWQLAVTATAAQRPAHIPRAYALGAVAVTPHTFGVTVYFWIWNEVEILTLVR